jgi:hypothetical protein
VVGPRRLRDRATIDQVPPMLMLQSLSEVDGGQEILRKLQKRFPPGSGTFEATGPEVRPIFGPARHGLR